MRPNTVTPPSATPEDRPTYRAVGPYLALGSCVQTFIFCTRSRKYAFQFSGNAAAGKESFYHVVRLKSGTQFVAREARLRHDHFRRTDREMVPKMDRAFQQT